MSIQNQFLDKFRLKPYQTPISQFPTAFIDDKLFIGGNIIKEDDYFETESEPEKQRDLTDEDFKIKKIKNTQKKKAKESVKKSVKKVGSKKKGGKKIVYKQKKFHKLRLISTKNQQNAQRQKKNT